MITPEEVNLSILYSHIHVIVLGATKDKYECAWSRSKHIMCIMLFNIT